MAELTPYQRKCVEVIAVEMAKWGWDMRTLFPDSARPLRPLFDWDSGGGLRIVGMSYEANRD